VRIDGKEQQYIDAAITDKDANIRTLPLRYVRVANKDAVPVVSRLAKDSSPEVRRECALSLHLNKSSEAPNLWADLAEQYDGKDRWYLEALGIGAFQQDDRFFDAWLKRVGDSWNTPAGRDIVWRSRSSKAPALIVKIIQDKNTPKQDRDRFFRALDFVSGPAKDAALVQLLNQ
jgi:hypothetical protein